MKNKKTLPDFLLKYWLFVIIQPGKKLLHSN